MELLLEQMSPPQIKKQPMCISPQNLLGVGLGSLYEIEIYIDQNQTGTRANKLNGLFPTTIKAASVEFLTTNFPGYTFTELVNFNILDNNSTGWFLDSINFSGKNLKSNPGFSSTKNFTTAGSVVGFTPTFPSGSKDIYAVSLAMGMDYSEFMMSASNVSRFLYGYENPGLAVGSRSTSNDTFIWSSRKYR
jgi:hypothetical protein